MSTPRDLTITSWAKEEGDSPFTVAVPGLKFTGWWPDTPPALHAFDDLNGIWSGGGATFKSELDILEDPDGRKHQICVYARIHSYPPAWLDLVSDSLRYLVERGAAIAWAGGWECFLQYSAAETFAGCYAAYTTATGFVCLGDLDDQTKYLTEVSGIVERLHSAVREAMIT